MRDPSRTSASAPLQGQEQSLPAGTQTIPEKQHTRARVPVDREWTKPGPVIAACCPPTPLRRVRPEVPGGHARRPIRRARRSQQQSPERERRMTSAGSGTLGPPPRAGAAAGVPEPSGPGAAAIPGNTQRRHNTHGRPTIDTRDGGSGRHAATSRRWTRLLQASCSRRAAQGEVVETAGLEPAAYDLQSRRSTS